jgi:ATPase subunit of ABC transporter with duplicated ATPase domains
VRSFGRVHACNCGAPASLSNFAAGLIRLSFILSLNDAPERYRGTLIFVSHDREFVSSLATRIIEMKPGPAGGSGGGAATVIDFRGNYEDYPASQGLA